VFQIVEIVLGGVGVVGVVHTAAANWQVNWCTEVEQVVVVVKRDRDGQEGAGCVGDFLLYDCLGPDHVLLADVSEEWWVEWS
jgi:hypothetical protein